MDDLYPKFFSTLVGLAPDRVKQLTAEDVSVMAAVFTKATGVNPLYAVHPLVELIDPTTIPDPVPGKQTRAKTT